jgi:hypothetical protein
MKVLQVQSLKFFKQSPLVCIILFLQAADINDVQAFYLTQSLFGSLNLMNENELYGKTPGMVAIYAFDGMNLKQEVVKQVRCECDTL